MKAEWVFVNVGCRPGPLDIPGAEYVDLLDSTSLMELDVVPEHLVVIGGGYVGLDFAKMFRRFGSRVTVMQGAGQLLGREDGDVAEEIKKILYEDGIEILLNSKADKLESVGARGTMPFKLTIKTETGSKKVPCSHVLAIYALGD